MSMSTEQPSSSPSSPSSPPHIDTAMDVGGKIISLNLKENEPNDNTAQSLMISPASTSQSAPVETVGSSKQLDMESSPRVTRASSAPTPSTERQSSSPHLYVKIAMAVGENSISDGLEGSDDTTQPLTKIHTGSRMVPVNATTPPSLAGNNRTGQPVKMPTSTSLQPTPAVREDTTGTSNHLANEGDAHVMPPISTPTTIAGRQSSNSRSNLRAESDPKKTAMSSKQSGSYSCSSPFRRSTAHNTFVQPRAPDETAQELDRRNEKPDARARLLVNVFKGRQSPSTLSDSQSSTSNSPLSSPTDTSLATPGAISTMIETNATTGQPDLAGLPL